MNTDQNVSLLIDDLNVLNGPFIQIKGKTILFKGSEVSKCLETSVKKKITTKCPFLNAFGKRRYFEAHVAHMDPVGRTVEWRTGRICSPLTITELPDTKARNPCVIDYDSSQQEQETSGTKVRPCKKETQ